MAIQVNGTQVIGNSRELTNIASVDATTVATLNAAGVGAAPGVAGITWTPMLSPTGSSLSALATDYTGTWVAVGSGGTVVRSTNNGASWSSVSTPAGTGSSLSCVGYGNGVWVIGITPGTASHFNQCLRSTNGGASWSLVNHNLNKKVFYLETDGSGVWVLSADREQLSRSIDDGASWSTLSFGSGAPFGSIAADGNGNWIVGGSTTDTVRTSTNDGASWTTRTVSGISSGSKISTDKSGEWVVVGGTTHRSTNIGVNWTQVPTVATSYPFYYDSDVGAYILQQTSSTLTSSTDGFQTNNITFSGFAVRVVRGDNNGVFVAVGSSGVIYRGTT